MHACTRIAVLLCCCSLLALGQSADLGVSKNGPGLAAAGANVTYTLNVTNGGPDDAASASLSDPLPPGMTFVSLQQNSGPAFLCSTPAVGTNGTVTCTIATFTSGSSAAFSLTVNIPPASPAGTNFTNIATISSATFDPNSENDAGAAATIVSGPVADVGVSKAGPASAPPGGNVTYTLTVFNSGPNAAANVALSDPLPGTMTFVSLSAPAGYACTTPAVGANGLVSCTIASLPAGASGNFTLVGKIPNGTASGTTFVNTATISTTTTDPSPENDSATTTTTVNSVDVSITKTGPATATAGSNVIYTITVANAGPDAADSVAISDALPPGATFVSLIQNTGPAFICSTPPAGAGGSVNCTDAAPFVNAASAQFTLTVTFDPSLAGSIVSNTATVSTSSFDTNPGNNSSTATTSLAPASDLAVVKSASSTVIPGLNISYTIIVTNNGPSAATSVTLTDPLPPGTTFVSRAQSGSPAFTCITPAVGANGTVSCTAPIMNSGAQVTFTLVVAVPAGTVVGSTFTNTATVTSATADPVPGNNSSSFRVTVVSAPTPLSVPTLSNIGLALLAFAMLVAAMWAGNGRRRRRIQE